MGEEQNKKREEERKEVEEEEEEEEEDGEDENNINEDDVVYDEDDFDVEHEAYHLLQWLFKFIGKLYNCPEEEDADDVSDDVAEEKGNNVRDFLDYFFVFITLFVAVGIALY